MAHQYKLKDKKVSIWYFKTEKVNGVNVKKWYPRVEGKVWAYYRQSGGNLSVEGSAVKYYYGKENALFVINNRKDVRPEASDIIIYNNKIYTITVVDDYEGYKEDLKLQCELAEDQNPDNYNGLIIE